MNAHVAMDKLKQLVLSLSEHLILPRNLMMRRGQTCLVGDVLQKFSFGVNHLGKRQLNESGTPFQQIRR